MHEKTHQEKKLPSTRDVLIEDLDLASISPRQRDSEVQDMSTFSFLFSCKCKSMKSLFRQVGSKERDRRRRANERLELIFQQIHQLFGQTFFACSDRQTIHLRSVMVFTTVEEGDPLPSLLYSVRDDRDNRSVAMKYAEYPLRRNCPPCCRSFLDDSNRNLRSKSPIESVRKTRSTRNDVFYLLTTVVMYHWIFRGKDLLTLLTLPRMESMRETNIQSSGETDLLRLRQRKKKLFESISAFSMNLLTYNGKSKSSF